MVTDTLENAARYFTLSPGITAALRFLQQPDSGELPVGKHPIDGDRVFALVQEYQTKPPQEAFWESHQKYIDVQCVQTGVEAMGWSPIQRMKLKHDYDPAKDMLVWEGGGQLIQIPAGNFVIFMPQDAHMPTLQVDRPAQVRKIVVKVAVE